ncbi:hypothetical protein [Rhodococcus sp. NPDC058521]|uniref:hypothetical protein n=1 Tax=Rhodococcus sp. NPDC058521 TaxID=3346536 RepID=UPI003664BEC7
MILREAPSIEPHGNEAVSTGEEVDDPTALRRRELRAFLFSTPARLTALGAVLAMLTLSAGVVTANSVESRQSTLETSLAETEPLANSAQDLYGALSVADAAATTGFISGGIEPEDVRNRYTQTVGVASAELVYAAAGLADDDADSRRLLASISSDFTVYTGLVETARANNRAGHPVGAAYLTEASTLMQTGLLPMAQDLHARQETNVSDTQRDFSLPPWPAIVLLVVALIGLVIGQVLVARRTRRTFNLGLISASAALGLLLLWLLVAGLLSSMDVRRALSDGAEPLHELTTARILAQQARAEETLKLVRRDSAGNYDDVYGDKAERLTATLEAYVRNDIGVSTESAERAVSARQLWAQSHERMNAAFTEGDFETAADITVGVGPNKSAAQFAEVDDAITDGIVEARHELRSRLSTGSNVLTALAPGALVLAVIAFGGIIIGLWPRLREYQ